MPIVSTPALPENLKQRALSLGRLRLKDLGEWIKLIKHEKAQSDQKNRLHRPKDQPKASPNHRLHVNLSSQCPTRKISEDGQARTGARPRRQPSALARPSLHRLVGRSITT